MLEIKLSYLILSSYLINDLPSVSNKFEMLMYADDTTLYCNINQNSKSDSLNNELKFFTNWLMVIDVNKLSLNIGKTKL